MSSKQIDKYSMISFYNFSSVTRNKTLFFYSSSKSLTTGNVASETICTLNCKVTSVTSLSIILSNNLKRKGNTSPCLYETEKHLNKLSDSGVKWAKYAMKSSPGNTLPHFCVQRVQTSKNLFESCKNHFNSIV